METLRIATLGPKGSYSSIAAEAFSERIWAPLSAPDAASSNDGVSIIYTTTQNALSMVENGFADYAVLPFENMVDGIIGSTIDGLIEHQSFVKACDEVIVAIDHVLAVRSDCDLACVTTVYSHISALNQCSSRLSEVLPYAELVPVSSTSEAAERVRDDASCRSSAVCSREAAIEYGLRVVREDIQDYRNNVTRFVVLSPLDGQASGNDRTLVAVRLGSDQPGQLNELLHEMAKREINLSFIQSRPFKIRPEQYVIVIEMMGHRTEPRIQEALRSMERLARRSEGWTKILGSYPKRRPADH